MTQGINDQKFGAEWVADFDHMGASWTDDPFSIWDELRERCPIAYTERYGGVYLPTRYDDISTIAYDTDHFSSRQIIVRDKPLLRPYPVPPMSSDPPHHRFHRMILMPAFAPDKVKQLEPKASSICDELCASIQSKGECDGVRDYAYPVALRVLCHLLGLPREDEPQFSRWARDIVITGVVNPLVVDAAMTAMDRYFSRQIAQRLASPGDDAISYLLGTRADNRTASLGHIISTLKLLVLAGIDTTASVIGASLWHLACHKEDRERLVSTPDLLTSATEEFLRMFAPTTMARQVVQETEIRGCPLRAGKMVLLPFAAANRDPEIYSDPNRAVLDRDNNRHLAFGVGIHRCIGIHLARMLIKTALKEWLRGIPDFSLRPGAGVIWSKGTVRGPIQLPLALHRRRAGSHIVSDNLRTAPSCPRSSVSSNGEDDVRRIYKEISLAVAENQVTLFVRVLEPRRVRGTVICLHGFTDNGSDFDFIGDAIAKAGYRVICPDMPGRGRSSWLPAHLYSLPTYFRCISAVAQLAKGRTSYLASSWSSFLVIPYLLSGKLAFDKVVLNDPILSGGPEYDALLTRIINEAGENFGTFDELRKYILRTRPNAALLPEDELNRYVRKRATFSKGQIRLAYDPATCHDLSQAIGRRFSLTHSIQRLRGRVLLTYGAASEFYDEGVLAEIASVRPDVPIVADFAGGHPPFLMEQHQARVVTRFLAEDS